MCGSVLETGTHLGYELPRLLPPTRWGPHSERPTMKGKLDDHLVHRVVQPVALFDLEWFAQKSPLGDLELIWSSPPSAALLCLSRLLNLDGSDRLGSLV